MHYDIHEGRYQLINSEGTVLDTCDEVALVFDNTPGHMVLHQWGRSDYVEQWYQRAVNAYRAYNYHAMADCLVMMSGKFPIGELNRLISTTGYINEFVRNHDITLMSTAQEAQ